MFKKIFISAREQKKAAVSSLTWELSDEQAEASPAQL